MEILVDSNVILDVLTEDRDWFAWSAGTLETHAQTDILCINPIIYSEVSISFSRIEEVENALPESIFRRRPIPWPAAFLAGKCFEIYRRRGGTKRSPLPDFFIGAHASVMKIPLITRDATRYRTYFPRLQLIAPDK